MESLPLVLELHDAAHISADVSMFFEQTSGNFPAGLANAGRFLLAHFPILNKLREESVDVLECSDEGAALVSVNLHLRELAFEAKNMEWKEQIQSFCSEFL